MLEKLLSALSNLHTDKNRACWSPLTRNQAPHKPLLLLSTIDLIARGQITRPFIEPSFELSDTFNGYWSLVMPPTRRGLPSYPFYHMRSEPFWQLVPNPGYSDESGRTFSSMAKIREAYTGAKIDEGLFSAMADPAMREIIRKVLIEAYFDKITLKDVQLSWEPEHIEVAASGDLAYTYGPYTFNWTDDAGSAQKATGIFHTVWRKEADGQWRYVWD